MHVLITGARAPVCLEWARAFGVSGWRVSVADSLKWPLTRGSCYVASYFSLPEPRTDVAAWGQALRHIVDAEHIDLVLPTCEEAFYLAHQHARLPAACRVVVDDFDKMTMLHHKGRFADITAGWPVSAPHSVQITQPAQLVACRDNADWVFKPAYSRFAARTLIRPPAAVLDSIEPSISDPWIAQRFVDGKEFCSYSVFVSGRLTAHACYHPKYRVGRGAGMYFEPANPPAIRDFVERFGHTMAYTGQVGFDFIESADGKMYVLECNPRATSGLHLFCDQPSALVDALLGRSAGVLEPHAGMQGMVGFAMVLFGVPRYGWRSHAFWRDLRAAPDAIMRKGDAMPALYQLLAFSEIAWRAARRRRPLLVAATEDIEWNGTSLGQRPC